MNTLHAILLGILEGLTEFLPVSSTGHLTLASYLLHIHSESLDSYNIVIQFGAILAVLIHYRSLLRGHVQKALHKDPASLRLLLGLLLAFLPVAISGLLFKKWIKAHLFGMLPVVSALLFGGILMIAVELWQRPKKYHELSDTKENADLSGKVSGKVHSILDISLKQALLIGVCQCAALWPGMSRSMSTILPARMLGIDSKTSAEFSFLLGLPTLGAVTLYEVYKARAVLLHELGVVHLLIGLFFSFASAWLVIAAFLKYLENHGLLVFGLYRVILAMVFYSVYFA